MDYIPNSWRNLFKNDNVNKLRQLQNPNINILQKNNKNNDKITNIVYKLAFDKKLVNAKLIISQQKCGGGGGELQTEITGQDLANIYSIPIKITNDFKLQSLQFKINHGLYYTTSKLMQYK